MSDDTVMRLRAKKKRRFFMIIGLFIIISGVLGLVRIEFLYILALGLMIVGVISIMNTGAQMTRWRYFTLPVQNGGFHEHEIENRREMSRISDLGLVLAVAGFGLFLLTLFLSSAGWHGLF